MKRADQVRRELRSLGISPIVEATRMGSELYYKIEGEDATRSCPISPMSEEHGWPAARIAGKMNREMLEDALFVLRWK